MTALRDILRAHASGGCRIMRSLGNWAAMAQKCGIASGALIGLERADFSFPQLRVHLLQPASKQPGVPRTVAGMKTAL